MRIYTGLSITTHSNDLPNKVKEAFFNIAQQQRQLPESTMLTLQKTLGGGVLGFVAEHMGDLLHRMTIGIKYGKDQDGYSDVKAKLTKILRELKDTGKFKNTVQDNIAANAQAQNKDSLTLEQEVRQSCLEYAKAFESINVYNRAQWLAKHACIQFGYQDYSTALRHLQSLNSLTSNPLIFNQIVTSYKMLPNNSLVVF